MLMFAGKVHHLRHFSFGDLVCVDAALADPMVMNMQHDSGRGLMVLVEKPLEHMHHEFHGRVIVVEDQHTIEARPLGLRLGLGDDRGSRPRRGRSPALLVIVGQPRRPPRSTLVGALVGRGLADISAEDGESDHGRANHGASHDTFTLIIVVKQAACQTAPMLAESLRNSTLADLAPVGRTASAAAMDAHNCGQFAAVLPVTCRISVRKSEFLQRHDPPPSATRPIPGRVTLCCSHASCTTAPPVSHPCSGSALSPWLAPWALQSTTAAPPRCALPCRWRSIQPP